MSIPKSSGDPKNPNLFDQVRNYEKELISEAMNKENGSVTRAARRLGIPHQSLAYIVATRHKELRDPRTVRQRRRRSSMTKEASAGGM